MQESILQGFLQTLFHSRFSDQILPAEISDDRLLWVTSRLSKDYHANGGSGMQSGSQITNFLNQV